MFAQNGLAELLHLAFRRRMRRHIRMQNPTASHFRWITLAQITTRTSSTRKLAVIDTRKSQATIDCAWLRTNVLQCCEPLFSLLGSLQGPGGVSATHPLVYPAGALIMMLMALVASALPALRAASADPIEARRSVRILIGTKSRFGTSCRSGYPSPKINH
jgi:hypothetical protein